MWHHKLDVFVQAINDELSKQEEILVLEEGDNPPDLFHISCCCNASHSVTAGDDGSSCWMHSSPTVSDGEGIAKWNS